MPDEQGTPMKKAGMAGFFHAGKEELLLHFFGSGLGCIGSGADCITSGLGGFGGSVSSRGSSSVSGSRGSSSVSGRGSSRGGISSRSGRGSGRSSGFGGRSRCFFRLRAGSEGESEQGGGEEGRFHFDFLG